MSKVYNGNTPELYELFLKGIQLQFQRAPWYDWEDIPVYNGETNDIYRVSNASYIFRVKPTEVIVRKYSFCDRIELTLEDGIDLNAMRPQAWWNNDDKMDGKYLEWVFTDNKLTAVNIIGED